jgi:arylsulfatase A-like enzyme
VTSDHGEEFFEHGDKGHFRTLFDEVLKVPLIVRLPGRVRAGERVTEQVRHVDIAPTLLSFAGVPERDELLTEIGGRSLAGVLEGREAPSSLPAISSVRRNGYWASVRTPAFKYIVNREGNTVSELLYDLKNDPREHRPLADFEALDRESPGILADLRKALMEKESTAFAARVVKEGAEDFELPAGVREQLRSLGYIE